MEEVDFYLQNLLNNAFDFLGNSIDNFETNPKYSIIHFCTAIELILKARLLKEHWSLIVDGEPNLENFKKGNFKSINFTDLVARINSATSENISSEIDETFKSIASERNKIIHFYHPMNAEYDISHDPEIPRIKAAVLELKSWEKLKSLLLAWQECFNGTYDYKGTIKEISRKIKSLESYYELKYKILEPEILENIKKGRLYKNCDCCNKDCSFIENTEYKNIDRYSCKVCGKETYSIVLVCPKCGKNKRIDISDIKKNMYEECINADCDEVFNINDCILALFNYIPNEEFIKELLDEEIITTDNYFEHSPINCGSCGSPHSCVIHNDFVVCVECGDLGNKSSIKTCGYCNERIVTTSNMTDSDYKGCGFCDGMSDRF